MTPHCFETCNASSIFQGSSPILPLRLQAQATHIFMCVVVAALSACVFRWVKEHRCRYLLRFNLVVWCINWTLRRWNGRLQLCEFFSESSEISPKACESLLLSFISSQFVAVNVVSICAILVLRYYWMSPVNIMKDIDSVGYNHLVDNAKKRGSPVARLRSRDLGHLPPAFPNGWIGLIESRELGVKAVRQVTALGRQFCVFRGVDGQAHVLDAYCPHLGANLAAGGRVVGNCIECPFHGWQFSGSDGKCSRVPYSEKVPDVARSKSWPVCEVNGFVHVWYHADGEPPSWQMPAIAEVQDKAWVYRGRIEHTVRCHIQELPENGADVAHLHFLHVKFAGFGSATTPGDRLLRHEWDPRWRVDDQDGHVVRIALSHELKFCGVKVPFTRVDLDVRQIGPATVHLLFTSDLGRGVFIQQVTPEGPLRQRIVHHMYTNPCLGQFPASLMLVGEEFMLCRDIAMWNNKKYLRHPMLVKEDKLISRFRRWYSQFYSSGSPTLEEVRDGTLDW